MNITLNQKTNKTSRNVTTYSLKAYNFKIGVVASSATNQIRIDFGLAIFGLTVNMVLDGTKGTSYVYFSKAPAPLNKCLAQSVPITTFNLTEIISGFNQAGQISSFLVSSGNAGRVPFNSKDLNSYYKYSINGVTEVTGDIYIGLTALSFFFDVSLNSTIIPTIPSFKIGSKNITIAIPTNFVAAVRAAAVAP